MMSCFPLRLFNIDLCVISLVDAFDVLSLKGFSDCPKEKKKELLQQNCIYIL